MWLVQISYRLKHRNLLQVEIQKLKKKSDEANMLIRASKVNSHSGVSLKSPSIRQKSMRRTRLDRNSKGCATLSDGETI